MKKSEARVSCIIPAHNEARHISSVLMVLKDHPLLAEVIVVNDGSTDETARIVKQFSFVTLINLFHNYGKAYAVWYGAHQAKKDTVMLLDADLIGLTQQHVVRLLRPVLDNDVDATMSSRRLPTILDMFIIAFKVDPITGDRCLSKELLLNLPITKETPGYALEPMINDYMLLHQLRIGCVNFRDVCGLPKTDKVGYLQGIRNEVRMFQEISLKRMLPQYIQLIARRVYIAS